MLNINEGGKAAAFLCLRDGGEGQGGFTRGFRAEDFHDTSAWEATNTERTVDQEVSCRDYFHIHPMRVSHPHDRGFTEFLLDLGDCEIEVPFTCVLEFVRRHNFCCCFRSHAR